MVEVLRQHDVTVIQLGPEYDSLHESVIDGIARRLIDAALEAEPPSIVVDMAHTRYIGSRFIEVMFRVHKRLRARGGALALAGVQPFCAEVLDTVKAQKLWNVYPSVDDAVAALST